MLLPTIPKWPLALKSAMTERAELAALESVATWQVALVREWIVELDLEGRLTCEVGWDRRAECRLVAMSVKMKKVLALVAADWSLENMEEEFGRNSKRDHNMDSATGRAM